MGKFMKHLLVLAIALGGCSSNPAGSDARIDGGDAADLTDINVSSDTLDVAPDQSTRPCSTDGDCLDAVFCNGVERCMPGAVGADARGCAPASPANPCMAAQRCDEAMQRCVTQCAQALDADGDGRRAIACGGDDCDDADPNRFPGNPEVCDSSNHDEDCDARTFGVRDNDGDRYVDARCCNADSAGTMFCGDDCNDTRNNVHPDLVEACDGLDNDCNGMVDEGATLTLYRDVDGDGFGVVSGASDAGTPDGGPLTITGCSPPPTGYALMSGDCDDGLAEVHPGALEQCDTAGRDENCDGTANPSALCSCVGDVSRACADPGACSAGTQRCVSGGWGACSIGPVLEVCNGVDDNCNGTTDEGLSITCYPDNDNDGYPGAGATAVRSCAIPGRELVAGCPTNQTNRPPMGSDIDCSDSDSTVSPALAEVCDAMMRDENCDGVVNPSSLCACTDGATRPCAAMGSCGAGIQTCTGGRFGACSIGPVAENCNGIDDDCDGMIDESLTVTCYPDGDNDGYARTGAVALQSCPIPGREAVGGCPTAQTNRAPGATTTDCDDANSAISPVAIETCDTAMVDENCDGTSNPASLCACSGTVTQPCPQPGSCAAGTRTCVAGAWTLCTVVPADERCNGVDDDCDGTVDESLTVTCYPDGDNDGYARTGAVALQSCPIPGRESVGGCPTAQTNRAPLATSTDCNDANSAISPDAAETCDGASVDENCDGVANPSSLCACSGTVTQPCTLPGACAAGTQTCVAGAWTLCTVRPVDERCNGVDDDCDGTVDEAVTTLFYPDCDGDLAGDSRASGSPACDPSGAPACAGHPAVSNRSDCNDSTDVIRPGAPEICDAALVDENCNGTANENCDCTIGATRTCCAGQGNQGCLGGLWGPCTVTPSAEVCDGRDNDCNGMIDEGIPTLTCYADNDRDGYVNSAVSVSACACPTGYFLGAAPYDCADNEVLVHPNQTGWFSTQSPTRGWDYDCSTVNERENPTAGQCSSTGNCSVCMSFPHWLASLSPACGTTAQWGSCYCNYDPYSMYTTCDTPSSVTFPSQRCH